MSEKSLGKISALVSVNVADIASKVQSGFAAPFEKALRQVETTVRNTNRSIEKSYADIYTSAQKQARALAAAQMGAIKNFNGTDFSRRMQIRDDIAEPVKRLAHEIEKTSGILRGNFEPRIVSLQAEVQSLFDRMAMDANSVATGEITALISKVDQLGSSLSKAKGMAEGMERLSEIGRGSTRNIYGPMFANLGAASRRSLDEVNTRAAANFTPVPVGTATMLNWSTPFRPGLNGPAGPVTTGIGASTDISAMGLRQTIPAGVLESSAKKKQAVIDEAEQKRLWAIRDADQEAFNKRQREKAQAIHDGEVKAIAREKAERDKSLESERRKREAMLEKNQGLRSSLRQEALVTANQGASSVLPTMTMLPDNYFVKRREQAAKARGAQTGDISRMGADRFALAIQQAGFAVDDFFSVTGNFEQRLRAVGNNLSQLGFIIGSTFGLLAVISVTATTQAVLMLRKFIGATAEAERREAELKASVEIMNSSLEKQASLVESLAQTYKSLGREMIEATSAPEELPFVRAGNAADDLRSQQAAARQAMFSGSISGLSGRASTEILEKQLREASDPVQRFMLAGKLAAAKSSDAASFASAEAAARAIAASSSPDQMKRSSAEMRERLGSIAPIIQSIQDTPMTNAVREKALAPLLASFKSISEELTVFDMALKIAGDDAKALGVQGFSVMQDRISKMQADLAAMEGVDASTFQVNLMNIGRDMAKAMETETTPAGMRRRMAAIDQRARIALADAASFMEDEKASQEAAKENERAAKKAAEDRQQMMARGIDLLASPKQKAVATFRKDLEAAALAAGNGPDRASLISSFLRNRATEVAPLLAQFAQERGMAAMAQYTPALQAADVTTSEGQRELNRLLRGEDSAKDVNLQELQQQTELLSQLVEIAQKDQDLVVDFK